MVAQNGRLLVCKAMLVSMATYNLKNLLMPTWFEKALKRDMAAGLCLAKRATNRPRGGRRLLQVQEVAVLFTCFSPQ